MIVLGTRNHPNSIAEANFSYEQEPIPNIEYYMVENEKLAQNL